MEKILRAAERIVNECAEFCRQMAERAIASGAKQHWDTAFLQAEARPHDLRDFVEQDWIRPENVDRPDPAIKTD